MMLSEKITSALEKYKKNRGIWRRLFSFFGFGYAPAIKSLRKLDPHKVDELQVLTCFIENMPKESQASYNVYKDIFSFRSIITHCLKILHQSKLLTKENFNAIKDHNDPNKLVRALFSLKQANLLIPKNFNVIGDHQNLSGLARALFSLMQANLLTQENFNAIRDYQNLSDLADALLELKQANLLTQENFNALKNRDFKGDKFPYSFASALFKLWKANLLTQENFNAIKDNNLSYLDHLLSELEVAKLLTQENFTAIKEHDPYVVIPALTVLRRAKLLTLENFRRLIDPQNNILLTRIEGGNTVIWDAIPEHLLTQHIFEELIRHALLENPAAEIQQYIDRLLDNWNKTKSKVADRLFDMFKSVYGGNKENSDFLGLVDAGQHLKLKI